MEFTIGEYMDKYKQYVDLQWWNGIEKRDIENWIRNFESNKDIAELILDNVIFYNRKQMKAYTRFLVNELKECVYMHVMKENHYKYVEDSFLDERWEEYLRETRFMPAVLPDDPSSSAHNIIGYWRSTLEHGSDPISSISSIEECYKKGVRRFVLVDDFSGSGEQMIGVLQQKVFWDGKEIEVGMLSECVSDIEIIVAVYVIHEQAKSNLKSKYPQIEVIYVDLINQDLNYLNEESSIYEKYDEETRKEFVRQIQVICQDIMNSSEEMSNLSSYVLNIPIVFEHGCPNNTLLLLFAHSDNWQQLFRRGTEI